MNGIEKKKANRSSHNYQQRPVGQSQSEYSV